MRKVDTKAVMTVRIKFAILLIVSRFINIVILKLYSFSAGRCPAILHHPQPLLHKKGLQP